MRKEIFCLFIMLIAISIPSFSQQASLTIFNRSNRQVTTKIMKGKGKDVKLYKIVEIKPKSKEIIYFHHRFSR